MRLPLLAALGGLVALAAPGSRDRRAGARRRRRRGRRARVDARRGRGADDGVPPLRVPRGANHELLDARARRSRPTTSCGSSRNVGDAAVRERRARLRDRDEPGIAHDAADGRGSRGLRLVRRCDRPRGAVDRARHHRQRAEPQPLLAPAVRARRVERRARRAISRSSRRRTTRSRACRARSPCTAGRSPRAAPTVRTGLVPRTLRRPSSRASEPPTGRAAAHDP